MARPVSNPPNPWESTAVEWLGPPPAVELRVYEERPKSVLSRNESPDLPFTWSVNPYRGCYHACAYCYARPTHQYLGFGAGTDFDSHIVVKVDAAQVLRRELSRPGWRREAICFSGNTDCYQPLEASYRLTRQCLEVCLERETPVAVITKGSLVRRDVELLAELERVAGAVVTLSIPFADERDGRRLEPAASAPSQRFATLEALRAAGVPTGVSIAPIVPGLNDAQIPDVVARAAAAGASHAFMTLLRLPGEVEPVFVERLRAAFPERAGRVLHALEEMRGGRRNGAGFGERMRGSGPRWDAIAKLFDVACRRHGLSTSAEPEGREGPSVPPTRPQARQRELFE